MNNIQRILKDQFPDIGRLFCCTIGGSLEFPKAIGDKWMQVVLDSNHWVLVAKGFFADHVTVYDLLLNHFGIDPIHSVVCRVCC
jgi:hypothetical protein